MPCDVFRIDGFGLALLGKHEVALVMVNVGHVAASFKLLDGFVGCHAGKAVESPEGLNGLHLVAEVADEIKHFGLRGLAKCFMVVDDELSALGLIHKLRLAVQLDIVVLFFHHHNDLTEFFVLCEGCAKA